jgi:signal transduction histidine kinase
MGAGLAAADFGSDEFDLRRFIIRTSYLVALSMILVWIGGAQRAVSWDESSRKRLLALGGTSELPIREIASALAERFRAEKVVIAGWEFEEPRTNLVSLTNGKFHEESVAPDRLDGVLNDGFNWPMLVHLSRSRAILYKERRRVMTFAVEPLSSDFAKLAGLDEALVIVVPDGSYGASIFISETRGMTSDDLRLADQVGHELSELFERVSLMSATEDAAGSRARLSLARDLHDSVVQFLAGMSFRLETVRRTTEPGSEIEQDIGAIKSELIHEQRELRKTIEFLRGGKGPRRLSNVADALRLLGDRLSQQWGVSCRLLSVPFNFEVPAHVQHDVLQLVREAVANAVRHGGARDVFIILRKESNDLELDISDDGRGFSMESDGLVDGQPVQTQPWSLHERVKELGGSLMLYSSSKGSRVSIALPNKGAS